jgi:orotate phosphoribosyltransferase
MVHATLDEMRTELAQLLQQHCFSYGDFVLASGLRSNYYYNGKLVSLSPRGAYLVGRLLFEALRGRGIEAVGGKALGADPLVTSVALVSELEGEPIPAFIVRSGQKDHGKGDAVAEAYAADGELLLRPGRRVAIVDDVATTGGSSLDAVAAAEARGCAVAIVVAIVDRQQGAAENFAARGYPFTALFHADERGQLDIPPARV